MRWLRSSLSGGFRNTRDNESRRAPAGGRLLGKGRRAWRPAACAAAALGLLLAAAPARADDGADGLIKDSNTAGFTADVIEASRGVPVIVALWASWCGPCRMLNPVLEKVVREAKGKLRLVKVDLDASPQIGERFRVQSIPTVLAVADGRVVDSFLGNRPESQVRAFAKRLMDKRRGGARR